MNLIFRMIRILLAAMFAKRTDIRDVHTIRSAVWLGDHDPLGHMTNTRYSSFTDLGLLNICVRSGALAAFRKQGWGPAVQYEALTFQKMMRFPQKFSVETRLAGWDGQFICFTHTFHSKGNVTAQSRMIARVMARGEKITVERMMDAMNIDVENTPLDDHFTAAIADLRMKL